MEMISRVVPTAFFIGKWVQKYKAGTIRNPPPIPNNPVMIPTISPCIIRNPGFVCSAPATVSLFGEAAMSILTAAKNIRVEMQNMNSIFFDTTNPLMENISSGMEGKINFLATSTPVTEGIPNMIIVLISTSL